LIVTRGTGGSRIEVIARNHNAVKQIYTIPGKVNSDECHIFFMTNCEDFDLTLVEKYLKLEKSVQYGGPENRR
jgi:hypothetical protein